jgi:hypothetical protein
MKQIISFLFIFSFYCLKAQDIARYVVLDSLERQLDVFKENERILLVFKTSFNEKDSLMVIKFQKIYEESQKILYDSESQIERDKALLRLQNEQKRIMKFEESVSKADSVLKLESRNWVKDYVQKEVRFYCSLKNIKPMIFGKQPHYIDANALNLISELTDFINQSAWKEEYEYHFNFIKNKVLFDFNLE